MRILSALVVALASCATEPRTVRFATFNTSLQRASAGELIADLEAGDPQARAVAAIIQRVSPDVLLLNEFDHDEDGRALALFEERYLAVGQGGGEGLRYAHRFTAPVNTGVPSGADLDNDGSSDGPGDAFGFGRHPGQYGKLLTGSSKLTLRQSRQRLMAEFVRYMCCTEHPLSRGDYVLPRASC